MILHPAVIALLVSSGLISFLALYSAAYGILIIRKWDLTNGSSLQLDLERRTYLISTVLAYVCAFQLLSLFLFVFTADRLSSLFIGAMCAAGTFNVNAFGYPVLILKFVNFMLAGLWLIVNHADNRGYDYPLIRKKYSLLLVLTPLLVVETILQAHYFLGLHPDVITSCCGSLFSSAQGSAFEIVAYPAGPMKALFFLSIAATLITGVLLYMRGTLSYLFSALSFVSLLVSIASLLSFIAPYVYELPTHHCPFCLLQKEYGYAGYPLYFSLFIAAITGIGVSVLTPFKAIISLSTVIPRLQKNLTLWSLLSWTIFTVIVIVEIYRSHLVL